MNKSGDTLKIALAAIIAMIAYGSLYPFAFHVVSGGIGPLRTLLDSWDKTPGRGDFISNILLYMPLGFVGMITVGKKAGTVQLALTIAIGAGLSFAVEYLQYYDAGRDTEATDFYANVLGTAIGASVGWVFGQDFRWPLLREISANRVPALLLTAWLGYRLYPYVPTIDLHKYWHAVKPVIVYPHLTPYSLFRHIAVWLSICVMIEKMVGDQRAVGLIKRFAAFLIFSCVLIISTQVTLPQILGMVIAFGTWKALPTPRARVIVAATLMAAYVGMFRLAPFQFSDVAGHFSWMPFLSFMEGSIDIDVQSFFEKFFLYGSLIWLLCQAGMAVRFASLFTMGLLLAASGVEIFIPGRSAEVTDAILALVIGEFIRAVESGISDRTPYAWLVYRAKQADTLTHRLQLVDPIEVSVQPAAE